MMTARALLLVVALATLLALYAAAPTDSRIRRRPTHEWLRRKLRPPTVASTADITSTWIEQVLDHFDSTNNATWKQMYNRRDTLYSPGGPVFVFINGESEADGTWLVTGYIAELAAQHGALMFQLEHRFYGFSRPTSDATTESLRYLNSTQALEDLATFIRQQRQDDPQLDAAKWIVFGGSYAGNLAAWARLRYPDIIDGAVASSAPVLAQVNFSEYLEVVGESMQTFDSVCEPTMAAASQEFDELLQSDAGVSTINDWFWLCEPLNVSREYDVAGVTTLASSMLSEAVQYNKIKIYGQNTVQDTCLDLMSSTGDTPLEQVAMFIRTNKAWYCNDPDYEASLEDLKSTELRFSGAREWLWQTCTEFGYYQTTDSANQPFGKWQTLPYYTDMCGIVFGSEYTAERVEESVRNTNLLYGGLNLNVTNVVFTNGALDPWHKLGVLEDLNESSPAIVIKLQAHCSDMYYSSDTDLPKLTEAHERIAQLVAQWVS